MAAVLKAGLRVVRGLALVVLVVGLIATVAVIRGALSSTSPFGGGTVFQPPPTYNYPSPSAWSLSPYPVASARVQPTPQVTVAPCPSWAPTLVQHSDGTFECKAYIPPDPGGPYVAPCEPALASPYPCPTASAKP